MADFKGAFQRGKAAFEQTQRAHTEIAEVLRALISQVEEASGGVKLSLKAEDRTTAEMLAALSAGDPTGRKKDVLVAELGTSQAVLCEVRRGQHGYPVVVSFGSQRNTAHDKESLEAVLVQMLEHPDVGKVLAPLVELAADIETLVNDAASRGDREPSGTPSQ